MRLTRRQLRRIIIEEVIREASDIQEVIMGRTGDGYIPADIKPGIIQFVIKKIGSGDGIVLTSARPFTVTLIQRGDEVIKPKKESKHLSNYRGPLPVYHAKFNFEGDTSMNVKVTGGSNFHVRSISR